LTGSEPNEPSDLYDKLMNQAFHRILDVIVVAAFAAAVFLSMRAGILEVAYLTGAALMLGVKIFIVMMDKVIEYDLQSFIFVVALFTGPIIALLGSLFRENEALSTSLVAIGSALFGMGAGANLEKSRTNRRSR
jgi:hypothetical protein